MARIVRAERSGLRIAIACRTLVATGALAWLTVGTVSLGRPLEWAVYAEVVAFLLVGVAAFAVIGTSLDRPWLKFALFTLDIGVLCALFVVMPISPVEDVPQIIAFRAYGIYYLFPLVVMSALALSWRLVAWAGAVAVAGWWTAFAVVVSGMERTLSWGDVPALATREDYERVFLSIDFVGVGNRVEETGMLLASALILALAVRRARQVFVSQLRAEDEREDERRQRERIGRMLGRYVPRAIAERLMRTEGALEPQTGHGAVMVLDVADFTAFAADREPEEVIAILNVFLARCSDAIADEDGIVITFTGDGLLATFGVPLETADPERRAVAAARAVLPIAAASGFRMRVGLAAGPIASGTIGSRDRQAFTVYGSTVNRAARLEQLGKTVERSVVSDEAVARFDVRFTPLGPHAVLGFSEPLVVYALGLDRDDRPRATESVRVGIEPEASHDAVGTRPSGPSAPRPNGALEPSA